MISAGGVAGAGYYAGGGSDEGRGRETPNYYTGASAKGEPDGLWHGRLAERLGLTGVVTGETMESVFDRFQTPDGQSIGRDAGFGVGSTGSIESRIEAAIEREPDALPERIEQIKAEVARSTRSTYRGMDLTFSPAKSVTVAHTAAWRVELESTRSGDQDRAELFGSIREAIEGALIEANEAAMEYASTVTTSRTGDARKGTITWIPAPDLVRASFLQHTSRAEDPQLHIHNPILNRARGEDGQIRALDTVDLRQQRSAISSVADRVLAERLADMGIRMELRPDGVAREIVGVDEDTMALFSQRRAAITKAMAPAVERAEERLGRELNDLERSRLAQTINLVTRESKSTGELDTDALLDQWQDRLVDELGKGLTPLAERIALAVEDGPVLRDGAFSLHAVGAAAVQACAGRKATWTAPELQREIELQLPLLGLSSKDAGEFLQRATRATLEAHGIVQVGGKVGVEPPRDLVPGSYVRPSSVTYAAPVTLEAEDLIRQAAIERGRHSLEAATVGAWLDKNYPEIGADQRGAALGIASSDAALTQIIGPAGTGKSYAAGALAGAWAAHTDGKVHGLAVGQYATEILRGDGVLHSANVAAWLGSQDRLERGRPNAEDLDRAVGPRDAILIDEASMVDTAQLTRVIDTANSVGARVILMGDDRQLSAVGGGGAMDLVAGRAETYALVDVRRFSETWEGPASLALREGGRDALLEYDRHGRLVEAPTLDEAVAGVARAAAADIIAGLDVVVTADTNETATQAANAIREHLVAAGIAEDAGITLNRTGSLAGIGDRVMTRQNDHEAHIHNRDRWTVVGVGEDGSLSVLGSDGQVKELSPEYVDQHVQLAYGSTVHAAQGATVDRGYLLTDGRSDANAIYVGLTRGRDRNTAFVSLRPQGEERAPYIVEQDPSTTARAVLEASLERTTTARAALVELEEDDARLASMHLISDRIEHVTQLAVRGRLEGDLDRLVEEGVLSMDDRVHLASDKSTEHLSRLVRAAEQAGHDPAAVLREAIEQRTLEGSKSVAQVIAARIVTSHDITAAVPGQVPPERLPAAHAQHLQAWEERAAARKAQLGTQVAQEAPSWAMRHLGPVPEDALERLEWEAKAGQVAGYREAASSTDDERAIPSSPGLSQTEQRAQWWGAWGALGRPPETRIEAALTDGQLQARVSAWEREQAWAPPGADAALKDAELRSEEARREALLTGDEALEQEAERLSSIARGVSSVVEARSSWASETAVTRDLAERAAVELTERGLEPGHERDRVSAEEWLQEQRAAEGREELHREVTELDVPLSEEPLPGREVEDYEPELRVRGQELGTDAGRSRGPRATVPIEPSDLELEALVHSAREAEDRAADHASEEAAREPWEAAHEPWEAERDADTDYEAELPLETVSAGEL